MQTGTDRISLESNEYLVDRILEGHRIIRQMDRARKFTGLDKIVTQMREDMKTLAGRLREKPDIDVISRLFHEEPQFTDKFISIWGVRIY